jgi:hypothetical protein
MMRILACILCAALLLAASTDALAVDKKKKSPPAQTEERKKAAPKKKEPSRQQSTDRKYDNFVDRNQNGIDDRKENLKTKKTPDKPSKSKATSPRK